MDGKVWPALPSVPHGEVWRWVVVRGPYTPLKIGLGLGNPPYVVCSMPPGSAVPICLVLQLKFVTFRLLVRVRCTKIVNAAFHCVQAALEAISEGDDV